MRIEPDNRSHPVQFFFNGRPHRAFAGESVAAALFADACAALRSSPRAGLARGMFCLMGSCQECVVLISGSKRLACQTLVVDGLRVNSVDSVPSGEIHA